jgi:hypothetical protein
MSNTPSVSQLWFKKIQEFFKNLFSPEPEIIQIGVGGFTSAGKTVLMESMFRVFEDCDYYTKSNNAGKLNRVRNKNLLISGYKDYSHLEKVGSMKFYDPRPTSDNGIWTDNTYCTEISIGGKRKTVIMRDIPGEMVIEYLTIKDELNDKLKGIFDAFFRSSNLYKNDSNKALNVLSQLFTLNIKNEDIIDLVDFDMLVNWINEITEEKELDDIKNNILRLDSHNRGALQDSADIEVKRAKIIKCITELSIQIRQNLKGTNFYACILALYFVKKGFLESLKTRNTTKNFLFNNYDRVANNFFPFLYYYTSSVNIYCLKFGFNQEEFDAYVNNKAVRFDETFDFKKIKKLIVCRTQFDKVLSTPLLNNSALFRTEEGDGLVQPGWSVGELSNYRYWKLMEQYLKDIDNVGDEGQLVHINPQRWNEEGDFFDHDDDDLKNFYTSVSLNYADKSYYSFPNQVGQNWTRQNVVQRHSIGVLELMLYILQAHGIKESNWGVTLPNDPAFRRVRQKLGID